MKSNEFREKLTMTMFPEQLPCFSIFKRPLTVQQMEYLSSQISCWCLSEGEHCQPSAVQPCWNYICLMQIHPWPCQTTVTEVKLWVTVLHAHSQHTNQGKITTTHIEKTQNCLWRKLNLRGWSTLHTLLCLTMFFSLCLSLPSRWALTSRDSLSRSTSPTSASISTPTCWKSASSQWREDPRTDEAIRALSLMWWLVPCQSESGTYRPSTLKRNTSSGWHILEYLGFNISLETERTGSWGQLCK